MNCNICKNNLEEIKFFCKDYISNETFIVNKCTHCKSLITHTEPDIDLSKYYGDNYYNKKNGKFTEIWQKICWDLTKYVTWLIQNLVANKIK